MSASSPAGQVRSDDAREPDGRLTRWLPLILGTIGLAVFALWYWNPGYRYDEYLVAVARTQQSWDSLLRVIATSDPGAGPLYLLMKPWTAISSDPWWTRIPSLVAMAVAVGALVAFVNRSVGTTAAVFAAVLMIALPASSRWAQDNRMYALATACVVLAVACWWRSVTGGSRRWSVAYGAAVAAMGAFHLYTLAVIPALAFAALWLPGPRRSILLRTIVPAVIAVIVLSPHLYLNLANPTGSPTNSAVSPSSVGRVVRQTFGLVTAPVVVLLAIGGSVWAWRSRDMRAIVALGVAWVLVPLLFFIVGRALLGIPTLSPRYYVFAIPGACLLAALGLAALRSRWPRGVFIALAAVVALAVPEQISVRAVESHSPDTYGLGLLLRQPSLAGLPVVAVNRGTGWTVDAATYPDRLVTPSTAAPQPVAVIVRKRAGGEGRFESAYFQSGAPWRPVVGCKLGDVVVEVVAIPGASMPAGDAQTLAQLLNSRVAHSNCAAIP